MNGNENMENIQICIDKQGTKAVYERLSGCGSQGAIDSFGNSQKTCQKRSPSN